MSEDKRYLPSDELLEKIFFYMDKLFEEKKLSETLMLLTDLGRTLVNCDRASFWFWDRNSKTIWTMAALGVGEITVSDDTGLIGASILENKVLITNDPYNDPRFNQDVDKKTGYRTKSVLTMPVTNSQGEVVGAYQAINKITTDGVDELFDEHDIQRLSLAAAFCGKSIESFILYNEMLQDQLTGLQNRKGFYSYYDKHILPLLDKNPAAMIMCDIDHFKHVNDEWGHNAGDAILKNVARIFLRMLGAADAVFRWGGEEFIFLLPDKNIEEAVEFAEKCRKEIENNVCHYEDSNGSFDLKITMSFGVCMINDALSLEANVKNADDRLYYAKEHGRNKVVSVMD